MRWHLANPDSSQNSGFLVPGRADGYPSGPPTDPYVRNSRIRFLKQSICCPLCSPHGGLVTRLVSTKSLSCVCPLERSARRRLPSRGSLGPHFPTFIGTMRRYDCHLPVSGASLVARLPDTLPASACLWSPKRAHGRVEAPDHARAFGHPVPPSGYVTRRQVALPSSRVTPMVACPALRPRWCPAPLP